MNGDRIMIGTSAHGTHHAYFFSAMSTYPQRQQKTARSYEQAYHCALRESVLSSVTSNGWRGRCKQKILGRLEWVLVRGTSINWETRIYRGARSRGTELRTHTPSP